MAQRKRDHTLSTPACDDRSSAHVADGSACGQDWEEGDGDTLAPELLGDAQPTPACDVFSLGATLYELATGGSGIRD